MPYMNQANGSYDAMPIVSSLHVFSMQIILCCLSSSVLSLQSMLDIRVSFRLRCNVMFHAKKSICIAVSLLGRNSNLSLFLVL